MAAEQSKRQSAGTRSASILLAGLKEGEEAPALEVHALDASGKVLGSARVDGGGRFKLAGKALDAAERIAIGPAGEKPADLEAGELLTYRARDFHSMLAEKETIDVSRPDWSRFVRVWRCVGGSVSHCYPYPWLIRGLVLDASLPRLALPTEPASQLERRQLARLEDAQLAGPGVPSPFPRRCERICDGLVEVYRRTCCCDPWIVEDPRLLALRHRLEEIAFDPPILRRPPGPWPDPGPWLGSGPWPSPGPSPDPGPEIGPFKRGALDEAALRAKADIAQIQALSGQAQVEYIEARPYLRPLWCSCGGAVKVGQGWLRPDGTFGVCWLEGLSTLRFACHDEYAFVVKQAIGDGMVTVYDGLAANRWFDAESDVSLVSYSPQARGCGAEPPPTTGAVAFLQEIGDTSSYLLKTPDADDWDSVATPFKYNDGLLNPVEDPEAAKGRYKNQNLGGTLKLRYCFSAQMEAAGAAYYRISVAQADGSGAPSGTRKALKAPLSWRYGRWSGTEYLIESEGLGPISKNGEDDLYRIPYERSDRHWLWGNEYHGHLDTTEFPDARHLVTLEVFDKDGHRLRPTDISPEDSSGKGPEADFTFRRWGQETGPTAVVPYAALTHLLWWDNRKAVARIEDLRRGEEPSGAECQFLTGEGETTFGAGYRAYHPNPLFVLNHRMWWRRGLGGPSGTLERSDENAGQPPAPVAVTDPGAGNPKATFANMLGPQEKCSFALNLWVNVKTTDGEHILDDRLHGYDEAAFALELESAAES